jgi:Uncharacterized protein conserved in bacteria
MRLHELQCKDVINVCSGAKLGYVCDVVLNETCLCVEAIVVCTSGFLDYLKFFQNPEEIVVSMCQVVSIGEDVILVNV